MSLSFVNEKICKYKKERNCLYFDIDIILDSVYIQIIRYCQQSCHMYGFVRTRTEFQHSVRIKIAYGCMYGFSPTRNIIGVSYTQYNTTHNIDHIMCCIVLIVSIYL